MYFTVLRKILINLVVSTDFVKKIYDSVKFISLIALKLLRNLKSYCNQSVVYIYIGITVFNNEYNLW